jgi:hypothetical protein
MNRRKFLIAAPLFVAGCASWTEIDPDIGKPPIDPAVTKYLVNTAGFSIGGIVAMLPEEVDAALRIAYNAALFGNIDVEEINKIVEEFLKLNDVYMKMLVNRLVEALAMLGAVVLDGKIESIDDLDPDLLAELGDGYVQGYDLAKSSDRKLVKG